MYNLQARLPNKAFDTSNLDINSITKLLKQKETNVGLSGLIISRIGYKRNNSELQEPKQD